MSCPHTSYIIAVRIGLVIVSAPFVVRAPVCRFYTLTYCTGPWIGWIHRDFQTQLGGSVGAPVLVAKNSDGEQHSRPAQLMG